MRLLIIISIISLFAACLLLSGCAAKTRPAGLNLSIGEQITPGVSVFVMYKNQERITSIWADDYFFPQQSGLPEGTEYGFRVIDADGRVAMPVYETFKAKSAEQIARDGMERGNEYYHNLATGKYTIELLTIKDNTGTIVARTNFSTYTQESQRADIENAVKIACPDVPDIHAQNPKLEENASYRDKVTRCVTDAAVSIMNPDACGMEYQMFNVSDITDTCITNYAAATGDTSACDKASMPKGKGFCKAKATKNWKECTFITCDLSCNMEGLDTQKDLCIQWYAIENFDSSLCGEIKTDAYREQCINILTQPQGPGNGS